MDEDQWWAHEQELDQQRWRHFYRVHNEFKAWVKETYPEWFQFYTENADAISKGSEKARKATAGAIGPEWIGKDSLSAPGREGLRRSDRGD